MSVRLTILSVLLLAVSSPALGCQFDTDCDVGSKCVKEDGKLYGFCADGLNPGNDNDRLPYRDPLDINQTEGDTCSFDVDCGPGSKCVKGRGSIKGVCVRKR
jgi:hypothetical protein